MTAVSSHRQAVDAPSSMNTCPIMPSYGAPSVMFVKGEGCRLWDLHGKQYLDFLSGLAVVSLGHSHPAIAEAVAAQAGKLQHVSNLFATEHNGEVARTLDRLLGGGGQVFFCNSGAEANEAALKLARRWAGHGRYKVISAFRSFHGRTLATLHATGQPEKHEIFQPLPEGFRHVPYGDIDELEKAIDETTAAVFLEPIMAEGGVIEPPAGYLSEVRALCDERGLLMMLDEVQTGLGRTGKWFAHQLDNQQLDNHQHENKCTENGDAKWLPDVVTMAKALGNGMPIGACWAKAEVASAFRPGEHATTFGGQPLATAAACCVLATMEEMDAPAVAEQLGAKLRAHLEAMEEVSQVRGRGLLLASELTPEANRPAAEIASQCLEAGLVVNALTPTAIRWTPPFVITEDDIAEAVDIFRKVLAE